MKKQLNVAVFAPKESMNESYRELVDTHKFSDPEIETRIYYIENIESLREHDFSAALFQIHWYKKYDGQDIRELLNQLAYSYWSGGITPNYDKEINSIKEFLLTEKGSDYSEQRFFQSLSNLSSFIKIQ